MRKGRKIVFVLGLAGRVSVCIHYCREIFSPALTMAARAKKQILAKRFAHAISVHYRDFEHAYVY